MTIREATNADADAIRDLVFGILAEFGLQSDPEGTDSDLADVEASYLARGGMFDIVVRDDGAIVGTVGLYPRGGGVCELRKMYLAPEARGRGLGRRLLDRAIERARRLGFRRIVLETAAPLVDAIALYTRNGFVPIASDHLVPRCDRAFALDLYPLT